MTSPACAVIVSGTGVSGPVAERYYGRLASAFATHHILALPGLGHGSLALTRAYVVARIEGLLNRSAVDPAVPVVVIGHSQGGLLVLEASLTLPRVTAVHALAAPLQGLPLLPVLRPLAHGFTWAVKGLAGFLADLIAGSRYLLDLAARLARRPDVLRRTTVWAFADDWLVPAGSAYLPGATNYLYGSAAEYADYRRAYPGRSEVAHIPRRQGSGGHLTQARSPDLRDWFARRYAAAAGPLDATA